MYNVKYIWIMIFVVFINIILILKNMILRLLENYILLYYFFKFFIIIFPIIMMIVIIFLAINFNKNILFYILLIISILSFSILMYSRIYVYSFEKNLFYLLAPEYNRAIQYIIKNQNNITDDVLIDLPLRYSYLSEDGKVSFIDDGNIINVEFFTERRFNYYRGYLYATKNKIIDENTNRETIFLRDNWFYEQWYD